jgi:hypothetical protein
VYCGSAAATSATTVSARQATGAAIAADPTVDTCAATTAHARPYASASPSTHRLRVQPSFPRPRGARTCPSGRRGRPRRIRGTRSDRCGSRAGRSSGLGILRGPPPGRHLRPDFEDRTNVGRIVYACGQRLQIRVPRFNSARRLHSDRAARLREPVFRSGTRRSPRAAG